MEGEDRGKEKQVDGQTDEGQEEEELQQKETEEATSNGEEGEREKGNVNNNEQTMEQDTQWTEMEISGSCNTFLEDVERDRQRRMGRNKEKDSEEEIKMDKDKWGRGQIRRRALKEEEEEPCNRRACVRQREMVGDLNSQVDTLTSTQRTEPALPSAAAAAAEEAFRFSEANSQEAPLSHARVGCRGGRPSAAICTAGDLHPSAFHLLLELITEVTGTLHGGEPPPLPGPHRSIEHAHGAIKKPTAKLCENMGGKIYRIEKFIAYMARGA